MIPPFVFFLLPGASPNLPSKENDAILSPLLRQLGEAAIERSRPNIQELPAAHPETLGHRLAPNHSVANVVSVARTGNPQH